MRLSDFKPSFFRFTAFRSIQDVMDDASDLIRWHGERAHAVAQLKSFQEDIGLALTPRPGHWGRVAHEIATRRGQTTTERTADFSATSGGWRS